MNKMHEYEIKSISKTLEFNPDLPKTSFSTNLSPKLKHKICFAQTKLKVISNLVGQTERHTQ